MLTKALTVLNLPLSCAKKITTFSMNECYHLHHPSLNNDCFLKIFASARPAEECAQEIKIQKLASQADLSPELSFSYQDATLSFILLPFYEPNKTLPHLNEMLVILKKFHALPTENIQPNNPLTLTKNYLQALIKHQADLPYLATLVEQSKSRDFTESFLPKLCHFDVHPNNFLVTRDRIYLIDFENAGLFDPLYDLAVLAFYLGLSLDESKALLFNYTAEITTEMLGCYLSYHDICLNLFLTYLSYHLLEHHIDINEVLMKYEPQNFQHLIKQYWRHKPMAAQLELEKFLLVSGLKLH